MCAIFYIITMIAAVLIEGSERLCTTDSDCRGHECCVKSMNLQSTYCREMGEDVGDLCGGLYFCPRCHDGMECAGFTMDRMDYLASSLCQFPANGTCQLPAAKPMMTKFYETANFAKYNVTGKRLCETDADCHPKKQCCAKRFEGEGKVCRDVGDEYGDSCGGDYFCNSCRKGLECVSSSLLSVSEEYLSATTPVSQSPIGCNDTVSSEERSISNETTNFLEEISDKVCLPPANGTCLFPVDKSTLLNATALPLPLCHIGFNRPCNDDTDCLLKECCAKHYNGKYRICREKGDDVGRACGGDYFCSRCRKNLQCVEFTSTLLDVVADLSRPCATPANGTCQYLWSF